VISSGHQFPQKALVWGPKFVGTKFREQHCWNILFQAQKRRRMSPWASSQWHKQER